MDTSAMTAWSLRLAEPEEVETLADLRVVAMRQDLERLGVFDEQFARQRMRKYFSPRYTSVIMVDGAVAGTVTMRPVEDGQWLEHFMLAPDFQGRGLGSAVLRTLLARADADGVPVRLQVLQGSAAQRLYERHGFTVAAEDPIDVHMVRQPGAVSGHDGPQRLP